MTVTICYDVSVPNPVGTWVRANIVPCNCHIEEVCQNYNTWVDDGGGGGGGGGNDGGSGSGGGTGGGGSGGGWQDDPCNANPTPPVPEMKLPPPPPCDPRGGDPWEPGPQPIPQPGPCEVVQPFADKATIISKDIHFSTAKNDIQAAAVDGKEHSIVFGKDVNGNISASPINNNGTTSSGTINTDWPGGFGQICITIRIINLLLLEICTD